MTRFIADAGSSKARGEDTILAKSRVLITPYTARRGRIKMSKPAKRLLLWGSLFVFYVDKKSAWGYNIA